MMRLFEPAHIKRYRQYRAAQVALNSAIVKNLLPGRAFDAAVEALGVGAAGRRLRLESEDEISVLMDYAIHEVGAPGARVIDRYRERPGGKDQMERELLDAAAASGVGLYRLQAIDQHSCRLTLKQLAPAERDVKILDISLSRSGEPNMMLFTRLLELPEFTMMGGTELAFKGALEAEIVRLWAQTAPRERYRRMFKLYRRSGGPLAYAGVEAGRPRRETDDKTSDEP